MSEPNSNPNEAAAAAIRRATHELGEHFEAVQILATRQDGEGTQRCFCGSGNFYARIGMAHEFIEEDRAKDAAIQIADRLNPESE